MASQKNFFYESLTREKLKTNIVWYYLMALALIVSITTLNFYLLYKEVASSQEEIIFNELGNKAKLLNSVIDIEAYEKLLASKEVDGDSNYLKILAPLRKAHLSVKDLRYVYTVYKDSGKDGKIYFGLDTALKIDADKDGVIDHSDFRSEYSDAPIEIGEAFSTRKLVFTHTPYTDKYGTFISAFIPLINSKGASIGVMGVDMLYSKYLASQESYKSLILKIYSVYIFLIFMFTVTLWFFYNKLIKSKIKENLLRTEIKEQQDFFIQDSKMSEIGKMVAGITHEINNPLTIIKGFSEQGLKKLDRDQLDVKDHRKNYQSIKNSTERIIEIIKNMKSIVARPIGTSDSYYFSISESLGNVMNAIAYKSATQNVDIKINFEDSVLIHGNRSQLEQVFFNLISNSIDEIAFTNDPWIKIYSDYDEVYVSIHFVDSGTKMTEELYKKIEQGFYTSKSNGSGMGLMICRKIIDIHHGELTLLKDDTTHFVVKLPINEMIENEEEEDAA